MARSSNLFEYVSATRLETSDLDYTLSIRYDIQYGDRTLLIGLAIPTGFCVPMYLTDHFKLTARVQPGKDGKVLTNYQYHDYAKVWYHILLFPVCPFLSPRRVRDEIVNNMLKQLFNDLARDSLLFPSREQVHRGREPAKTCTNAGSTEEENEHL